jgi:hypothetical protein
MNEEARWMMVEMDQAEQAACHFFVALLPFTSFYTHTLSLSHCSLSVISCCFVASVISSCCHCGVAIGAVFGCRPQQMSRVGH